MFLFLYSAVNLHAMRMGPGKHLQGLSLMNGLVKPEEVSATIPTLNSSSRPNLAVFIV